MAFLLTCSFISKACDLADRLGLSFVVLLSLLTDLDFLSSFFDGILGSILRLTALILLAALSWILSLLLGLSNFIAEGISLWSCGD